MKILLFKQMGRKKLAFFNYFYYLKSISFLLLLAVRIDGCHNHDAFLETAQKLVELFVVNARLEQEFAYSLNCKRCARDPQKKQIV